MAPRVVLRPRARAASMSTLPRSPRHVVYTGPEHGGEVLVECRWEPADGVDAASFMLPWLSASELQAADGPIVLTVADIRGRWVPYTFAMASSLPGAGRGLFAAADFRGGALIGYLLDGQQIGVASATTPLAALCETVPPDQRQYLYELHLAGRRVLLDGAVARDAGPRLANSPRGSVVAANCRLYSNGLFCAAPGACIYCASPTQSRKQRLRSELLWDYGAAYHWANP